MMASIIPLLMILLTQIRIRSFWDANNAIWGLIYSLVIAGVCQVLLKWLIGGLRPNFLSVCDPIVPIKFSMKAKVEPMPIMYDRNVCTGNKRQINHSLESFPSGHSTIAFSGFVYLAIYLNAKLKIWSNYHPAMWKMALFWAPILSATLISASLTIDGSHNWYDCLAGGIIGTVMAFSAYRMVFASIWDYEYNHIPLDREISLRGKTLELTATQKAGWGGGRHSSENFQRIAMLVKMLREI
ncbi:PA-phosphatase related-family protein [Erysiphe neolycopersici]|uniref:PA-phosphatase related-family protein n=1 Tax=Erysiphe neolycopersici TaxID=212602 RepID=A0A420HBM9_9PEZI|nr:PA-phosphatase related-family protein [Erysiphe neolycopersici]